MAKIEIETLAPTAAERFPVSSVYPLPGRETLALNKADWEIDPRRCALLVHDMQNFWVDRFEDPSLFIERISSLIGSARTNGIPVIYSVAKPARCDAERGVALDLWGPGIQQGDDAAAIGAEIIEPLAPSPQDFILDKPKYSAFFDTEFEAILRRTGRSQLIITGVYANHGCLATALDGFMRSFQVFFAADATADYSRSAHIKAIEYVAETSGVITTYEDVVAGFER